MTAITGDTLVETWESVHGQSLQLANMIATTCQENHEQFDAMIVVPRGSYYPANIVARELGFGAVDLLHACIGSYPNNNRNRQAKFQLGQMPQAEQVQGKDLLIIEEVCDSGHTLEFLNEWLKQAGARTVRTGTLHYKPGRNQTGFRPDWFVTQTNKWIVYPWEMHEVAGETSKLKRISS